LRTVAIAATFPLSFGELVSPAFLFVNHFL
jgi:hypothetical protein